MRVLADLRSDLPGVFYLKGLPTMFYIYGIVDPITGEIRYVGYTSRTPAHRLASHLADTKGAKAEWLHGLLDSGVFPTVVTLQTFESEHEARIAEKWWICHGQMIGWHLLNDLHTVKTQTDLPKMVYDRNHLAERQQRPKSSRWQSFAIDWFAENPEGGPSALARAMCLADNYNEENFEDYKSRAHRLYHTHGQTNGAPHA